LQDYAHPLLYLVGLAKMKGIPTTLFVLFMSLMSLTCHAFLVKPDTNTPDWSSVVPGAPGQGNAGVTTFSLPELESSATNYLANALERSVNTATLNHVDWNAERLSPYIGNAGAPRVQSRVASVPEPGVVLLLVTGLLALVLSRRRGRG
jgi:hypothetical protein